MKIFYKQHKIIVILFSIALTFFTATVTAIILFNASLEGKEAEIATFIVTKQPDDIFKGVVESEMTEKYMMDASLGKLSEINVKDGQEVKVGDTLLTYTQTIDHSDIDLTSFTYAKLTAEQTLFNAKQDLADVQAKDSELRKEFQKVGEDEKAEIVRSIEANNEAWQTAIREVKSAQLALEEANANLDNAEKKLSQTVKENVVKADFSGIVAISNIQDDSVALVQVISPTTKITAQISEFDLAYIKVGTEVSVQPINSDQKYNGNITNISIIPRAQANDSATAYYDFTVKLEQNLQNGFNVQVHLEKEGYIVPKSAVHNKQVKLKKADKFITADVQIEEVNGKIIVKSGLKKGDMIAENFEDIK